MASGSTLLLDAHVTGAVVVKPGASLEVENSTVTGPLTAQGAAGVQLCGTRVGGSVTITGTRGFVLVGDPSDDGCAANTIGGSLTLRNNTHGLDAIGNTVSGSISRGGNSGRGPGPGDKGPEIVGNRP